jgi:hypothetical protein
MEGEEEREEASDEAEEEALEEVETTLEDIWIISDINENYIDLSEIHKFHFFLKSGIVFRNTKKVLREP